MSHNGSRGTPASEESRSPWPSLAVFTLLVFAWAWGIVGITALSGRGLDADGDPLFVVAVYGASLAGIVCTAVFAGRAGLRDLGRRATHWRVGIRWWLVVLAVPGALFLGAAVEAATRGEPVRVAPLAQWPLLTLAALAVGPLGEELGWRGFALPQLRRRLGPVAASVVLGATWGVWHLPVVWLVVPGFAGIDPAAYLLTTVLISIVITWIYESTGGSVLVSGIGIHLALNWTGGVVGLSFWTITAVAAVAAGVLLLATRGLRRTAGRAEGAMSDSS